MVNSEGRGDSPSLISRSERIMIDFPSLTPFFIFSHKLDKASSRVTTDLSNVVEISNDLFLNDFPETKLSNSFPLNTGDSSVIRFAC